MTTYQLAGYAGMKPGTLVEVAAPYNKFGLIISSKRPFELPDKCVVNGPCKLVRGRPLEIYVIRGIEPDKETDDMEGRAMPVWGWDT